MDSQLALTVVITGLVVVFVILICLTFIIKGYGALITKVQNKSAKPDRSKAAAGEERPAAADHPQEAPIVESGIPQEVVAAIAASVSFTCPTAVVSKIRRAPGQSASAWKTAGLLENTRPF